MASTLFLFLSASGLSALVCVLVCVCAEEVALLLCLVSFAGMHVLALAQVFYFCSVHVRLFNSFICYAYIGMLFSSFFYWCDFENQSLGLIDRTKG